MTPRRRPGSTMHSVLNWPYRHGTTLLHDLCFHTPVGPALEGRAARALQARCRHAAALSTPCLTRSHLRTLLKCLARDGYCRHGGRQAYGDRRCARGRPCGGRGRRAGVAALRVAQAQRAPRRRGVQLPGQALCIALAACKHTRAVCVCWMQVVPAQYYWNVSECRSTVLRAHLACTHLP